jgi:NAD(P)H-quinone oxidoreductase subunit 5
MTDLFDGASALPILLLAIPPLFALGAGLISPTRPLGRASVVASLALLLAAVAALGVVLSPVPGPVRGVRLDLVTVVMLVLVCGLGLLIVRFSRSYLRGDPGEARYVRWLLAVLGAVTLLVVTDHLLVLAAAWTATSLALHQLLTFYEDRRGALVAAHKKFLVSRLADLFIWGGIALVYEEVGSPTISALEAWAVGRADLPASMVLAAFCFVIAAALKSAQVPFHGWLMQVMEAPTPVSALLHAGVVNLGGFLMIRLASLMALAPSAQLLLVVIGMSTTVIAAMVMSTRPSVKSSLAWSTCAQMGFMLAQCGLGAWHLALLHLVAHSLYKAHAFLSCGSTVHEWRVLQLGPSPVSASPTRQVALVALLALGGLGSWGMLRLLTVDVPLSAALVVSGLGLVLSVAPILARPAGSPGGAVFRLGARCLAVIALFASWHALAAAALEVPVQPASSVVGWLVVGSGFVLIFSLQVVLRRWPGGAVSRALEPWLFAGLYLDERFTRLTFRIWPPRLRWRALQAPAPAGTPHEV